MRGFPAKTASPSISQTPHDHWVSAICDAVVIKAYEQCKRFTDYLASAPEVSIYNRIDDAYVEVGKLHLRSFRIILPIGLTVEAFTPFSAMAKELADVQPLLGNYPFISMSVDDLFVFNRFLPTIGMLMHYLEVRQASAGVPNAMLFDETEHLGAYITDNRFDMRIKDQLEEAAGVIWDSFGDVVDKYFEGDTWKTRPAPGQRYPEELTSILNALDKYRPSKWLEMDAFLRDFGSDGRKKFALFINELKRTLQTYSIRRVQLGEDNPLQVWLCRGRAHPQPEEMRYHAEVGCLTVNAHKMKVLRVSYSEQGQISRIGVYVFDRPLVIQANYRELKREAERQRKRMVELEYTSRRPTKKGR